MKDFEVVEELHLVVEDHIEGRFGEGLLRVHVYQLRHERGLCCHATHLLDGPPASQQLPPQVLWRG